MNIAKQFIENRTYKNALIIGADALSKATDYKDRSTCIFVRGTRQVRLF